MRYGELLIAVCVLFGMLGCASRVNTDTSLQDAYRALIATDEQAVLDADEIEPSSAILDSVLVEEEKDATERVADGIIAALQEPQKNNVKYATIIYRYEPNHVYKIFTAKNYVTDIQLEPGEQLTSDIVLGRNEDFTIETGISIDNETKQQVIHIYISPLDVGFATNAIIPTNTRTYHLNLYAYNWTRMISVRWQYERRQSSAMALRSQPSINLDRLHQAYTFDFEGDIRKKPAWFPDSIIDDGTRTFLYFSNMSTIEELPVIFYVRNGNIKNKYIVNSRIWGNFIVVDGYYDQLHLTTDENDKNYVIVKRLQR